MRQRPCAFVVFLQHFPARRPRRAARDDDRHKASEAAIRAQIEAELEERVARDIQAERDRVAAESAALQAKIKEFEEQRKAAARQAAVEEEVRRAVAEREAAVVVREEAAAETLALGRALSEKVWRDLIWSGWGMFRATLG